MRPALESAVTALYCSADEPWVLLDEHQVHGRIPDLVVGRIDVDVLRARLEGGWDRALGEPELRALHAMRPDRGRSLGSVADQMHVGETRARDVLRRLVVDGFAEQTGSGSYARRAPIQPVLNRVVSVEAKRSDLVAAFSQARSHATFADLSIVVFDAAYRRRAAAVEDACPCPLPTRYR